VKSHPTLEENVTIKKEKEKRLKEELKPFNSMLRIVRGIS